MTRPELNKIHRDLRKHRFLYYERDESVISDYDYDMLEKKYIEWCERLGVKPEMRINSFVGFSYKIPMNLFYDENKEPLEPITVVNRHKHKTTPQDVYIGRGSVLGNPFTSIKDRDTKAEVICDNRQESVERYKKHLDDAVGEKLKPITDELNRIYKLAKTGNVNLVCYCAPKLCHGDVIKELIESKLK